MWIFAPCLYSGMVAVPFFACRPAIGQSGYSVELVIYSDRMRSDHWQNKAAFTLKQMCEVKQYVDCQW